MVILSIWKERNRILFRNEIHPISKIENYIKTQIRETMQSINFTCQKTPKSPQDLTIMHWLQLKYWSLIVPTPHALYILSDVKNWTLPQTGFLKLNFDGTSKGNPGKVGAGGVIKDSGRKIIFLYSTSIGNTTNNAMEFGYLERGL
jgi:hypothetical protein